MLDFSSLRGKKINWPLLMLSFALALLLWGYVTVQDNPVIEQRYDVQIDYLNLPDNLALADKDDTVRVKVSATASVLGSISAGDIGAYVDLSGAQEGQYVAKIKFDMPGGVQLVSSDDTEVVLDIDSQHQRQYKVSVAYTGDRPADGYMALAESLMPEEVVLSGAEDKLALVDQVYVTVDLTDMQGNLRADLPVNVVDAGGKSLLSWLSPQPASIDVLVPVVSNQPTKVAPVSVTLSGAPAEGYVVSRIIIDPPITTVMGAQSLLDTVDYVYTSAVNISGATSAVNQTVSLLSIDGVDVDKNATYQVRVMIEREAVRTVEDVAITLTNQNTDYNYQLAAPTCTVVVRGPASAVNGLNNTDIEAQVDVGALGLGEHLQNIRVVTAANATVSVAEPVGVTVAPKAQQAE